MSKLRALFVGVARDPLVVGATRAILLYLLPVAVMALVAYVQGWTNPRLVPLIPAAIALIRALEAAIDRALKPEQNAVNPPPVAGGGDPDLKP